MRRISVYRAVITMLDKQYVARYLAVPTKQCLRQSILADYGASLKSQEYLDFIEAVELPMAEVDVEGRGMADVKFAGVHIGTIAVIKEEGSYWDNT